MTGDEVSATHCSMTLTSWRTLPGQPCGHQPFHRIGGKSAHKGFMSISRLTQQMVGQQRDIFRTFRQRRDFQVTTFRR
jgi:hypothetical protein